jgi:hypothetical protein
MSRTFALLALVGLLAAVGCTRAVRVAKPNPSPIDGGAYDRAFRAAAESLRDMGYQLDRQDYRFGIVSTQPRTAPTLFEPWHGDNTTTAQTAESSINHQRRIIKVTLTPDPASSRQEQRVELESIAFAGVEAAVRDIDASLDGDEPITVVAYDRYLLEVEVRVERQQRPTRRLTGSTAGRNIYGSLRAVPEEWQARGITAHYWLPRGRDLDLEQRVLHDILRRAADE